MWLNMSLKKKRVKRTRVSLCWMMLVQQTHLFNSMQLLLCWSAIKSNNLILWYPIKWCSGAFQYTCYFRCQHTCRRSFSATTCQCADCCSCGLFTTTTCCYWSKSEAPKIKQARRAATLFWGTGYDQGTQSIVFTRFNNWTFQEMSTSWLCKCCNYKTPSSWSHPYCELVLLLWT